MCAGFAPFSSALFPGKCSKPLFSVPWSLPARRSSAFPTRVHRRAGHADGVWAHCRRVDVRHHRRDSLSGDGRARKGAGLCRALIVIQQIEGNLISPQAMGKRVGPPFLRVLVAITLGSGVPAYGAGCCSCRFLPPPIRCSAALHSRRARQSASAAA